MASNSHIEWTDASWNCLAGCEAVSPGCAHCYAATMTRRLEAMGQKDYAGLTTAKHFNGTVRCLPDKLSIPLKWRKPRRVFVNSMSDLFHEDVPDEFIAKVFAVMALTPRHTFQILTKRAERLPKWFKWVESQWPQLFPHCTPDEPIDANAVLQFLSDDEAGEQVSRDDFAPAWPLPNVWLGVSCEDQQRADERIPHLLRTPAAVHFVSAEPLLGPIDFGRGIMGPYNALAGSLGYGLGWVIVGGESGHGARPCDVAWIRSIVQQCQAAGVACFVKQLGSATPICDGILAMNRWKNKKGGDPAEWPEDLRVREFPAKGRQYE